MLLISFFLPSLHCFFIQDRAIIVLNKPPGMPVQVVDFRCLVLFVIALIEALLTLYMALFRVALG